MSGEGTTLASNAVNLIGVTGQAYTNTYTDCSFVFEYAPMDVSATFTQTAAFDSVINNTGLLAVDAIGIVDVNANNFSRLFYIVTNDIDSITTADNMSYGVIGLQEDYPGVNPFTLENISFSHSKIIGGFANPALEFQNNTMLYQDYVRYTAKRITGGYALSDIFANEMEMLNGVVDMDTTFNTAFADVLEAVKGCEAMTLGGEEDAFPESEFIEHLESCRTLVNSLLKDAMNTDITNENPNTSSYVRGTRFLEDLKIQSDIRSQAEADLGDPNFSGFADNKYWVIFHPGDVMAVRLNFEPQNGNNAPARDANNNQLGNNPIMDRSYKIYLRMT
jgi:hypothetical protein